MLRIFIICACVFVFSCASSQKNDSDSLVLQIDQARTIAGQDKAIDSDYLKNFTQQPLANRYYNNFLITQKLYSEVDSQKNSKKNLVHIYLKDLQQGMKQLSALGSESDKNLSWVPLPQSNNYLHKINIIVRLNESYKMLSKMGIFLSAMGVFNVDGEKATYYLELLDKANFEMELALRSTGFVYSAEAREGSESQVRINSINILTNQIRNNLRKVFPQTQSTGYKKIDVLLKSIAEKNNISDLKNILASKDFSWTANYMKQINAMNSSDIEGFKDDENTMLATKYNFLLVAELIRSAR